MNEKYAFKKLTDCIQFKLLTHYTSGHKRTGLAISKRVEGAALRWVKAEQNYILFKGQKKATVSYHTLNRVSTN